jgi:formate hydrogenlyase subunit 6/NADH:ubiquinone oxidoreductase subunit I
MVKELLSSLFKKPATVRYPGQGAQMPKDFRGKLKFYPEKCIGCKLCMRDCPAGAIEIVNIGEKRFEAHIDLGRCMYCGQCVDSCLKKALEVTAEYELAQLDKAKLKVIFHASSREETSNTP